MTFPATLAGLPADLLKPLPFFVYGTLQTGYTNHANVVRGRLDSVAPARISGGEVFHFPAGYPGLYETPEAVDNVVIGQLITAATTTPEELGIYYELLEELDALEEFFAPGDPRNVYERVERDVTVSAPQYREDLSIDGAGAAPSAGTTTVSVRAWVYICKIDQGAFYLPTKCINATCRAV